jgi:hypothetical protein
MERRTTKELKPRPPEATDAQVQEAEASERAPDVRTASKQQFDKAHRKTTVQHADLFRRLAK